MKLIYLYRFEFFFTFTKYTVIYKILKANPYCVSLISGLIENIPDHRCHHTCSDSKNTGHERTERQPTRQGCSNFHGSVKKKN